MVNKCSIIGCKSNYKSNGKQYVSVFSLPSKPLEKKRWLDAVEHKVVTRTTNSIRICSKHWPSDEVILKEKKCSRPKQPPSIFPIRNEATNTPKSRKIHNRRISMEQRTTIIDELDAFEKKDRIKDFDELSKSYLQFLVSLFIK